MTPARLFSQAATIASRTRPTTIIGAYVPKRASPLRKAMSSSTQQPTDKQGHPDTKSLPSRAPSAQEKQLIDDILELYKCNPSEKSYSHYAPSAVFHDPVSIAKGLGSIKSQFNGMPKAFSKSVTKSVRVLDSSDLPSSFLADRPGGKLGKDDILLDLTQEYTMKAGGKTKEVNSSDYVQVGKWQDRAA